MDEKKLNLSATVDKIRRKAEGKIKDLQRFERMMSSEEFVRDAALLWEVELVYE